MRFIFVAAGIGLIAAATVPAEKEVIVLEHLKGKKGPVTFEHKKHTAEDRKTPEGEPITCKNCHHTQANADETPKACGECHVGVGEEQKVHGDKTASRYAEMKGDKFDKKKILLHKNCVDNCHKLQKDPEVVKKLKKCKTCHIKKK